MRNAFPGPGPTSGAARTAPQPTTLPGAAGQRATEASAWPRRCLARLGGFLECMAPATVTRLRVSVAAWRAGDPHCSRERARAMPAAPAPARTVAEQGRRLAMGEALTIEARQGHDYAI